MEVTRRARAVAVGVLVALLGAPLGAASAKPQSEESTKTEARARLERGRQLYAEGAFEAALVEFQRAYELNPSYKILYNIGLIEQQLNDFVAALRNYQRYLVEGKGEIPASRRTEVEKSIATLKQSVATVVVTVDLADAEVSIDDVAIGRSPLPEPVMVNAGHRRVVATKDGRSAVKVVSVAGGDTSALTLEIGAPPKPSLATTTTTVARDVEPPSPSKRSTIPWVGVAVTGALAAGAVVTGVLALRAQSTLRADREVFGVPASTLEDDQARTRRFAIATDVLAVGALVAGGVTLVYALKKQPSDGATTGATSLRVGVAPNGLFVAGAF